MYDITCTDINGNPIEYFTQWDVGQKIYIRDLKLSEAPLVHFTNVNRTNALTVNDATLENGVLVVKVPNELLAEPYRIIVYLYEYDLDTRVGKTIHTGKIEIRRKTKPDDYIYKETVAGINIVALDARVRTLMNREKEISSDITSLKSRTDNLESRLSSANLQISDHTRRITNIENVEIPNLKAADTNLDNRISQETQRIDGEIQNLTEKDSAIESDISSINENIEQLQSTDSGLSDRISALETDNESNKNSISENTDAISNLSSSLSSLESSVTSEVQRIDGEISQLQSADSALDGRITALESDNTNNKNAISENSNSIAELSSSINSLSETVASETSRIDSEISDVKTDINDNTTQISELKSDLGEFTKKEIGTNLLPPDTEEGTYNLSTGEKENSFSIVRTPNKTKIPIGLSSINVMINKPCNRYLAMLFYKEDGSYLGYKTVDLEGKTQATLNVIDGSEYITVWVGDNTYSFDHVCVYSGSLISEFQPYERKTVVVKGGLEYDLLEKLNNIDETLYNKNLFSGKTIVNFGDSIFGNNDSDTSTSNEIAKHLKATVLNCGFGGTRMSDSRGSNREWSNFDAPNLINAVVNGDFSAQENAISQGLPGGTPGYFAYRLRDLKAINFNGVDIITLNQGTNDYTSGVAIDNNGNLEDLTKYKGAIRYIVKNILSKYPHIDIFLVSPTWRYWKKSDGSFDYDSNEYKVGGTELHNLRDYVVAMREVAEELNIKFIDCYNIGINKYNCSMYFPSDDGTHHNEFGRAKLGEHIARQLLSN